MLLFSCYSLFIKAEIGHLSALRTSNCGALDHQNIANRSGIGSPAPEKSNYELWRLDKGRKIRELNKCEKNKLK